MNITVIYATGRKAQSNTYQIAQLLIKELLGDGKCFEFHLPKDMPHICTGCRACINGLELNITVQMYLCSEGTDTGSLAL